MHEIKGSDKWWGYIEIQLLNHFQFNLCSDNAKIMNNSNLIYLKERSEE